MKSRVVSWLSIHVNNGSTLIWDKTYTAFKHLFINKKEHFLLNNAL